jgi:hypothetical protein
MFMLYRVCMEGSGADNNHSAALQLLVSGLKRSRCRITKGCALTQALLAISFLISTLALTRAD